MWRTTILGGNELLGGGGLSIHLICFLLCGRLLKTTLWSCCLFLTQRFPWRHKSIWPEPCTNGSWTVIVCFGWRSVQTSYCYNYKIITFNNQYTTLKLCCLFLSVRYEYAIILSRGFRSTYFQLYRKKHNFGSAVLEMVFLKIVGFEDYCR